MENKKEIKLLVGINQDNELYFIEIEQDKYFSMSGFTIKLTNYDDAVRMNRDMLEDGEWWRFTNKRIGQGL